MENLTLTHTKERLKLLEQRIKDDQGIEEAANKAGPPRRKDDRKCFFCDMMGHIKVKCFKWLDTNEGYIGG